jgi:hypothetical protein
MRVQRRIDASIDGYNLGIPKGGLQDVEAPWFRVPVGVHEEDYVSVATGRRPVGTCRKSQVHLRVVMDEQPVVRAQPAADPVGRGAIEDDTDVRGQRSPDSAPSAVRSRLTAASFGIRL